MDVGKDAVAEFFGGACGRVCGIGVGWIFALRVSAVQAALVAQDSAGSIASWPVDNRPVP